VPLSIRALFVFT
jgi:hypothetical protein